MLEKILNQKAVISIILIAVFIGGILSYKNIGKLEDAEIPIKTAMVITAYPGATAHEVELEVSDVLEKAIQKLENVKEIKSVSQRGLSLITVELKPSVSTSKLPQLYDHLRRKVGDAKSALPADAMDPIVNDDFADTYGMFYAVTADGYSIKELEKYTTYLERELLKVEGIRRSQVFGKQTETVDIIFSPEKLASLNINPMMIAMEMQNQNKITNAGYLVTGQESIKIGVGSKMNSINEIKDLLIQVPQGGNFRLNDIATVKRSVMEPKREALYFNGKKGLSLGLSNESGVNVVELGERVDSRIIELKEGLPAGIEIHSIYSQPERVAEAMTGFVWNLIVSVIIVIVVLLFSMGYRSGLLISSGLIFTILGTLIVMVAIDLPLHRVTLAAIILAMGMLVDNSIVVADGILVDLKKGVPRKKAFLLTPSKSALPLLGATIVAILAFMPLAMSPNTAGEYLTSLFTVLIISLLLSWVFAMIQTPFMAKYFYRKERPKGEHAEGYDHPFFKISRKFITYVVRHKKMATAITSIVLVFALGSFKYVKMEFMPSPVNNQFFIEYYLPQGSSFESVENDIKAIQSHVQNMDCVVLTNAAIGRPPARYTLMRYMPSGGSGYGELIIEAEDIKVVDELIPQIDDYLSQYFPNANFRVHKYGGSFTSYNVEVEFAGADPKILRALGEEARTIISQDPKVGKMNNTWRNQTKTLNPKYNIDKAQVLGLTRSDLSNSLLIATDGMPIGAFYEGETHIPVILKLENRLADNVDNLLSIPVWGQRSQASVPLSQIVDTVTIEWQDEMVTRIDGTRSLRIQFDGATGVSAAEVQAAVYDKICAIDLPAGYERNWYGEVASSGDANKSLFKFLPLAIGLMLIIIVALFNSIKQSAIIFIIVPFAFVGVALGHNITGVNLSFLSIIGCLGLIGMMIKNAIVLLDQINYEVRNGKAMFNATVDSAVSRIRPVMMASLTTILGMIPLLFDKMFLSMAVSIMFGLMAGSVITLVVVPLLYALFFNVDEAK